MEPNNSVIKRLCCIYTAFTQSTGAVAFRHVEFIPLCCFFKGFQIILVIKNKNKKTTKKKQTIYM